MQNFYLRTGNSNRDWNADRLAGFELPDINPGPGDFAAQRRLQRTHEFVSEVLVGNLNEDLRIIELLPLGVN